MEQSERERRAKSTQRREDMENRLTSVVSRGDLLEKSRRDNQENRVN